MGECSTIARAQFPFVWFLGTWALMAVCSPIMCGLSLALPKYLDSDRHVQARSQTCSGARGLGI